MELIKLTKVEKSLRSITFTLKELCDELNIRHDNAMRDLKKELSKLPERERELLTPQIEESNFTRISGKGITKQYKTYLMSFEATLWFMTKYDSLLRYKIVNYAINKLEEDHKQVVYSIQQKENEMNEIIMQKENEIKELEVKLQAKPEVVAVNTSQISRKKRSEELERLREIGYIDWEEYTVTHKKFIVTEAGKSAGFYIDNNVVKWRGE